MRNSIAAVRIPPVAEKSAAPHRSQRKAIKIPPARTIRDENEVGAIRRPFRLKDRFGRTTGDPPRSPDDCAVLIQRGDIQNGAVPWHVGMIPPKPSEAPAIGRQPRRSEEVVSAGMRRRASNKSGLIAIGAMIQDPPG
jgi:hypothetical protein